MDDLILNYNARTVEKTVQSVNWDEESSTKAHQITSGVWCIALKIFTGKRHIFRIGKEKFVHNCIIWRQVMCLRCNSVPGSRCQQRLLLLCQAKNKTEKDILWVRIRKWQRSTVQNWKQKGSMKEFQHCPKKRLTLVSEAEEAELKENRSAKTQCDSGQLSQLSISIFTARMEILFLNEKKTFKELRNAWHAIIYWEMIQYFWARNV